MKLMIFDMDGVLYRGANFWLEFHHRMATAEQALDLWKTYGDRDYAELSRITAALWKGRSAETYLSMLRQRQYMPGVRQFVSYLKDRDYRLAIVSSGPWHLAELAQADLQLDAIRANRLGIDADGLFDGTVDVQVDNNSKQAALGALQAVFGVAPADTVVIGDTLSDARMAERAGQTIGFRVRGAEARQSFMALVDGNSLADAIPLVA